MKLTTQTSLLLAQCILQVAAAPVSGPSEIDLNNESVLSNLDPSAAAALGAQDIENLPVLNAKTKREDAYQADADDDDQDSSEMTWIAKRNDAYQMDAADDDDDSSKFNLIAKRETASQAFAVEEDEDSADDGVFEKREDAYQGVVVDNDEESPDDDEMEKRDDASQGVVDNDEVSPDDDVMEKRDDASQGAIGDDDEESPDDEDVMEKRDDTYQADVVDDEDSSDINVMEKRGNMHQGAAFTFITNCKFAGQGATRFGIDAKWNGHEVSYTNLLNVDSFSAITQGGGRGAPNTSTAQFHHRACRESGTMQMCSYEYFGVAKVTVDRGNVDMKAYQTTDQPAGNRPYVIEVCHSVAPGPGKKPCPVITKDSPRCQVDDLHVQYIA